MIFALVDCNNFYASCERVFRPEWRKLPSAILSNNDGCLIARSDEIKELGYKLGASYFKLRKKLAQRLRLMGIGTTRELADLDCMTARKSFSIVMVQTVRELQSCIPMEDVLPDAQHLMVSRGFKGRVTNRNHLEEAVATYATRVTEKAWAKNAYAGTLQIFIRTCPFSKGPRYVNNASWNFLEPYNDTLALV